MVTVLWTILATLANANIRVDLELCSSRTSPTKLLEQGNGRAGSLYMRVGYESRYEKVPNVYVYTKRDEKPAPFYIKGNLKKANQLEVQYRSRDILCLERLTLTDEEYNYSIDILEDWAKDTTVAARPNWTTLDNRKVVFLTDSCAPDGRELSKYPEFKRACTSHIFAQYNPHRSKSCFSSRHTKVSKCGTEHLCLDTPKGARCACSPGYKMKKDKCVDIDECANFTHGCVGLAQCLNTDGGYECKCPDGLSGDRCDQDINECKAEKQCNNKNQMCINTHGSFFCQCERGFRMNEHGKCDDIDECADARVNTCWSSDHCRNTPGSYKCYCPEGFTGNGRNCNDIDECASGTHNCHALGRCMNRIGSFQCACNDGTLGNGTYCEVFPPEPERLHSAIPSLGGMARSMEHDLNDDELGVQCALNDYYRPWVLPDKSCPEPSCEAKLDIINAWHTTTQRSNKRAAKLYGDTKDWWGWSGTITVPLESVNDFAVILRFPRDIKAHAKDVMRGNFETWNLQMRSFAASDGGYDLLLTPKDKRDPNPASNKYELLHPNQFQIVAQRLKSPYFPSIVFWNTTQQIDHNCFGEQTAANMEMMKQRVRRDDKIEQLDDVRKLVLVNDEIRRLRRL